MNDEQEGNKNNSIKIRLNQRLTLDAGFNQRQ